MEPSEDELLDSTAAPQIEQSGEENLLPLENEAIVRQCEEGEGGGIQEFSDEPQLLGSLSAGDEANDLILEPSGFFAAASTNDEGPVAAPAVAEEEVEPVVEAPRSGGKRKRGRPPKAQSARPPPPAKKKEEEEVCFICFDGGNLVVCDRRGCPKVYHPVCVNRDEAFFQSKGRWNCGWHICSICEKAAHYMCYTCTYSLCKGCIKEAGFVCIRGNKGFCETCYGTVMLIESKKQANEGKVGVDFDDKSSFEYLFSDYWFDLKGKLNLTLEELNSAKSPRKGPGASAHNEDSSDELYNANDDQEASSDSSSGRHEGGSSSKKKVRRRSRAAAAEENPTQQVENEGASRSEDIEWASKELLEFVAHMKDGDKSILSQFDVQALLLEYIKQNNLRDPRRKSQIICDPRLENLFGKSRVGHFEMLKLLESHFLIKEASQAITDENHGGAIDPDSSQLDAEGYHDAATKTSHEKRRKNRKKVGEREPQTNLDDYAAIDVHNIGLIYLKRNLVDDLLDDLDKFTEKVVGCFVRIRISGAGQKQELYRLVQVVGTGKTSEKYKTGRKMTDFTLDILNLDKTELITIDSISNQEFTQEECKRLRQSIKCGLISRLTVGDIQEKARVLQAVRVNDWLESEKLRLGHLRDRASETGRRKELRECVEKLQLLSSPDERRRRLSEVPEIHADPHMDPDYESADEGEPDNKNLDSFNRSREHLSGRKGREIISPGRGVSTSSYRGSARKSSTTVWESSKNTPAVGVRDKGDAFSIPGDRTSGTSWNQGKDVHQTTTWAPLSNTDFDAGIWNNSQPAIETSQAYGIAPETMAATTPSNTNETEKIWNYKDPSGKIQGPFTMAQLRKWNTTGYFPVDLRIWQESESEDDSILLSDALAGKFEKDLPQWEPPRSNFSQPTTFSSGMDSRMNEQEGGWKGNNSSTWVNNKQNRDNWTEVIETELPNSNRLPALPAPRSAAAIFSEGRSGISPRGWEPPKDANAWPAHPQGLSSLRPTAPFSGNPSGPPFYQGGGDLKGGNADGWNRGQDQRNNWSPTGPRLPHPSGQGYDGQHSNWSSSGQQSSRNQWGNDSFNIPNTQPRSGGWISGQSAINTPASPTPAKPMGPGWGNAPNIGVNGPQLTPAALEHTKAASLANSRGGWGLNSALGTNAAQVSQGIEGWGASHTSNQQTDALNPAENHSALSSRDVVILSNNLTVLGRPSANQCSGSVDKKQFFESECPSPTPGERQGVATVQLNESDLKKNWPGENDRRGEGPLAVTALGMPDPSGCLHSEEDNLKSVTSGEEVQNLGNSRSLSPEAQGNLSPIIAMENRLVHPELNMFGESVPIQKPEDRPPASAQKQELGGLSPTPAPLGLELEQNRTREPNPSLGPPNELRGGEWSLPSPTPATKPFGWVGADTTISSQNNPWISSDGSKSLPSSLAQAATPIGSEQPSQPGWGAVAHTDTGPAYPKTGWGAVAQGNTNIGWGTPAQVNANLNTSWGTPGTQGSTSANAGWVTPQQENLKSNTGWGTPSQGNTNLNAGLGASHPGWGQSTQGSSNPNSGWGTAAQQNAGWGTGQENTNGWGTAQNQSGDNCSGGRGSDLRHDTRFDSRHDSRYDSRYGGRRDERTDRMSHDWRGGSSRLSLREQRQRQGDQRGVCKFHESGHCKKGASCNFLHS